MPTHTCMPARTQRTPHGAVSITSRWKRDHYVLNCYGPPAAVAWLFPRREHPTELIGAQARTTFEPAPAKVTVERDLRAACALWQQDWDRRLQDLQDLGTAAAAAPPRPQTLRQLYDFHQEHRLDDLAPATRLKYPLHLAGWLLHLGGDTALDALTAETITAARRRLAQSGLADSTVNARLASLKKLLNLAHDRGWVAAAPWREVADIRVIRPPTRHWDAGEIATAFRAAAADPVHPRGAVLMLVLGVHLGLRKNEAVNVRWADLDLDRVNPKTGEPSPICRIQQRPGFTTKTYENRIVPISLEGRRLLLGHCDPEGGGEYVLTPERRHRKRGGTKRVYRFDTAKLWARVLAAAMKLGAKRITYHEMRHSFACACLRAGHNIERVARWLGHRDGRMVRQHYAHLLDFDENTDLRFMD